ncbi:MAG: aldehyde dehydrogenase family protein [Anaerolineae bacterium]|jgi:acyl-CoA reductase-like NAD-dependent aldehyde dehydrogenase
MALNQQNVQFEAGFIPRINLGGAQPPTSQVNMDAAVAELAANKETWAALTLDERISILDQCLLDLYDVGEEWVAASIEAKGVQGNNYAEAEEWAQFGYILRNIRLLVKSLRDIRRSGRPQIPGPVNTSPGGQVYAKVFPVDRYDSMLFSGMTAEVWMQPGLTREEVLDNQAWFYRQEPGGGKVNLVLGAGNGAMLVPVDFLYKLFVEGSVVLLKMNPVNDYLGPIIEKGFRALIDQGYLHIIYGGVQEGSYLCHHPSVDELHMTGSDKTFEAILFGLDEEGQKRKEERQPLIDKRFTCELGNVTPVIVVPGPWTQEEIDDWGEKLARWLVINAGFNCLTPRVIIQSATWEHRRDLTDAIGKNLAGVQTRKAYYPGAEQRHEEFLTVHPRCDQHGLPGDGHLPWTLIQDVDPANKDDICFKNEAFCGLFAETALSAENVPSFIASAVDFANEHLWGNLTATIIVHPRSLEDSLIAQAVERAVADLRYGTVLINQYAAFGYFAMTTPWGAYPGNTIYNIQSGIGVNCNTLMFHSPQKTVVRNPFTISPDPLSLHAQNSMKISQLMSELQFKPSLWKLPGMLWYAIRS